MGSELEVQKPSGKWRFAVHAGLHYLYGIISTNVCEVKSPSAFCRFFHSSPQFQPQRAWFVRPTREEKSVRLRALPPPQEGVNLMESLSLLSILCVQFVLKIRLYNMSEDSRSHRCLQLQPSTLTVAWQAIAVREHLRGNTPT